MGLKPILGCLYWASRPCNRPGSFKLQGESPVERYPQGFRLGRVNWKFRNGWFEIKSAESGWFEIRSAESGWFEIKSAESGWLEIRSAESGWF